MKKLTYLIFAAGFVFPVFAKDIYLLVGQSNMAGRGNLGGIVPVIPSDRIEKLDKNDRWTEATEPLHFDKPSVGAGLGMSFARIIADRDRAATIGLVPCAVGGSALNEWMPGAPLYTEAIRRAKIAAKDGEIKAILWHQGESDADQGALELTYNERLSKMVAAMRKELSLDEKKVPFLFGAIGEFTASPYLRGNASFNRVQRHAVELIPNSAFVEAADLLSNWDKIHFDTASVRTLGERYAAAYLKLKGEELRFKNIFTDHMVLQRGKPIVIAGYGKCGAKVKLEIENGKLKIAEGASSVGDDGKWSVTLPAMKAGGPYEVIASDGKSEVKIVDVMIGEVWLCAGQSNMEMPVWGGDEFYRYPDGEKVAAEAKDPLLRLFKVEQRTAPEGPKEDAPGHPCWVKADDPAAVMPFSATGYFFGKELRKKLGDVAVGLVGSYWGGTPIRAWTGYEQLKKTGDEKDVEYYEYTRDLRPFTADGKSFLPPVIKERYDMMADWTKKVEKASGAEGAALRAKAMKIDYDDKDWNRGTASLKIAKPGIVWYRWHLKELPEKAEKLSFRAAWISDTDEAWFDGEKIGETDQGERFHWMAKRIYPIRGGKDSAATTGEHVLTVRAFNHFGDGGIENPEIYWVGGSIDLKKIPFCTKTEIVIEGDVPTRPISTWGEGDVYKHADPGHEWHTPCVLYNGMIAPLKEFPFTGVVWYQGCSEASSGRWETYDRMQKGMVESWREYFANPDMVYICTQLAGFEEHRPTKPITAEEIAALKPRTNGYVFIRPVQEKIRELKGCECISAIDIGQADDIHPKNKPEVARRLAAAAGNLVYGEKNAVHGPKPISAKRDGAAVVIEFDSDIEIKDGAFLDKEFTLAGKDGVRVWAAAEKTGKRTVKVDTAEVAEPVKVDYGWAPWTPKMSIYNRGGFPATPFSVTVTE